MLVKPTLATIPKNMTPVIHMLDDSIVLIPSDYEGLANLPLLKGTDTPILSVEQYKVIAKTVGLKKSAKGTDQAYFARRCKEIEVSVGNVRISEEGWAAVFEAYAEEGYTMSKMLTLIPKIVCKYKEIKPNKMLEVVGFRPTGLTEEQKIGAAIAVIECDDNSTYDRHYTVDGETQLLYTYLLRYVAPKQKQPASNGLLT